MIEALLVLPLRYVSGQRYPTLLFLHGGPEKSVTGSFNELISARVESAAHLLAAHGYAVLLPNFRGSSGYGAEFLEQLQNYQMMSIPYRDAVADIDYLIEEGVADPEGLGVYGSSFGGQLTAWTVSQTSRFKGAVASIWVYDRLHDDRLSGTPFHALRPNRLGDVDPKAMWLDPDVYRKLSPIEHIAAIETPVMIIESGAERRVRGSQARLFYNGLSALGIETRLVYYPKAYHGGGWNDDYKRDYMNRLIAWFDHCLRDIDLPKWFNRSLP